MHRVYCQEERPEALNFYRTLILVGAPWMFSMPIFSFVASVYAEPVSRLLTMTVLTEVANFGCLLAITTSTLPSHLAPTVGAGLNQSTRSVCSRVAPLPVDSTEGSGGALISRCDGPAAGVPAAAVPPEHRAAPRPAAAPEGTELNGGAAPGSSNHAADAAPSRLPNARPLSPLATSAPEAHRSNSPPASSLAAEPTRQHAGLALAARPRLAPIGATSRSRRIHVPDSSPLP